ncbi:MAG: bifunctional nuclease family protein [Candidatus Sumerlaeaceae bacterium]|jgi:bifunctional DNase/RNase
MMNEDFRRVELREIHILQDPTSPQVIVLAETEGPRSFPIFIGANEAAMLDMAVRGHTSPRPLTHDLILNVLEGLGAQLLRVLVTKLENDTFYGALEVQSADGSIVRIDARPSDSIILATKCQVPILVAERVLDEVGVIAGDEEDDEMTFDSDEDSDLGFNEDDEPEDPDFPDEQR